MTNYYYLDDIQQVAGPYTLKELDDLSVDGVIFPLTKVVKEGTERWFNYQDLRIVEEVREKNIEVFNRLNLANKSSFFALTPSDRKLISQKLEELLEEFKVRALEVEEIAFFQDWESLKDRQFGENFLTQIELTQSAGGAIPSSNGSKLNRLSTLAAIISAQSLGAIEKDIDDMADQIVGEDYSRA
jgi:hypothetical protein